VLSSPSTAIGSTSAWPASPKSCAPTASGHSPAMKPSLTRPRSSGGRIHARPLAKDGLGHRVGVNADTLHCRWFRPEWYRRLGRTEVRRVASGLCIFGGGFVLINLFFLGITYDIHNEPPSSRPGYGIGLRLGRSRYDSRWCCNVHVGQHIIPRVADRGLIDGVVRLNWHTFHRFRRGGHGTPVHRIEPRAIEPGHGDRPCRTDRQFWRAALTCPRTRKHIDVGHCHQGAALGH
jgi:hypothetical protein